MNHRTSIVEQHRAEILREARRVVGEAKKNLDAIERCLVETNGFPVYLTDLPDHASALMCLAAQASAITKLGQKLG